MRYLRAVLFGMLVVTLSACSMARPNASKDLPQLSSSGAGVPAPKTPLRGTLYTDPQKRFRMTTGSDWTPLGGKTVGTWWNVAPQGKGYRSTVSLVALPVQFSGSDAQILAGFERFLPSYFDGVDIIEEEVVTSDSGNALYTVTFDSTASTGPIRVYTVLALGADYAAAATLATEPREFSELRPRVERYLYSLDAS